jgi:hypothetical protein
MRLSHICQNLFQVEVFCYFWAKWFLVKAVKAFNGFYARVHNPINLDPIREYRRCTKLLPFANKNYSHCTKSTYTAVKKNWQPQRIMPFLDCLDFISLSFHNDPLTLHLKVLPQ